MSTLIRNGNKIGGGISELEKLQIYELPTPSAAYAGKIYQYVGATNEAFTSGFFYKCELNSNDVYNWKEVKTSSIINDTGASNEFTYSSQRIQTLLGNKADTATTYSKIEVDSRISAQLSSALKYKGKVATVAALPADAENGDSYIVEADDLLYAWNDTSSQWDALGGITDLTDYYTKTEVDQMLADMADKFQFTTMPTADSTTVGKIIQYIGADTNDYKNGYWYKGVDNGDSTYRWSQDTTYILTKMTIDNCQKVIGKTSFSSNEIVDVNDLQESGIYSVLTSANASNLPRYDYATWWEISVITKSNLHSHYCHQIAIGSNDLVYVRQCDNAVWSDWQKLATTDDILDNNYNGAFMAATVAWFKTGTLFAYPNAGGFWSSTFLLSDRDGAWTGILKIADDGAGSATATIASLGANPRGGEEFYFDETSYCLYFCGTWDRITITQLTGKKADLSITSTTQEEAKQNIKIVPINVVTEDNSVKILSSDTFTDMNALLADLKTRGTGFYKGKAYLSSTALWHDYDICINIGVEGYWYGIGNLRSEAGAEYYVYKTYSLSDSWTIQKLVTESDLPIKKMDISATGGATSFSTTIPFSMAQRNKPFYLEVLSVGNSNAIKEMKYLVFVSSMTTTVTTKEISKDSNFTNVSITFNESIGYELSFSSSDTLYSTTVYIQQ